MQSIMQDRTRAFTEVELRSAGGAGECHGSGMYRCVTGTGVKPAKRGVCDIFVGARSESESYS